MSKRRSSGFKQLACKGCGSIVEKVDMDADSVICSKCVQLDLNGGFSMTETEYWAAVKSGKLVTCKSGEEE
jgi:hypothetical protein